MKLISQIKKYDKPVAKFNVKFINSSLYFYEQNDDLFMWHFTPRRTPFIFSNALLIYERKLDKFSCVFSLIDSAKNNKYLKYTSNGFFEFDVLASSKREFRKLREEVFNLMAEEVVKEVLKL